MERQLRQNSFRTDSTYRVPAGPEVRSNPSATKASVFVSMYVAPAIVSSPSPSPTAMSLAPSVNPRIEAPAIAVPTTPIT